MSPLIEILSISRFQGLDIYRSIASIKGLDKNVTEGRAVFARPEEHS